MSTVLRGHVEAGRIVVDDATPLPEGAEVKIELVAPPESKATDSPQTLYDRYKQFAGIIKDYPSDFAENHDHYIHGRPQEMKTVFADTFYYLAYLGERDAAHERALRFAAEYTGRIVTTAWVPTELADAFAAPEVRTHCAMYLRQMYADPALQIVPPSDALFQRGLDLYAARGDKEWSLTDCISFVVMGDLGIVDALTGDRHFEQAGYTVLLK